MTHLQQLADALRLPFVPEIVCPQGAQATISGLHGISGLRGPYAVLHANPAYRYKRWTDRGWQVLARALADRGLTVTVTGGPDAAERGYLDALWDHADPAVVRLDGKLDWPQLAALSAGAAVYVGVDTSMTHLAAGAGCPTIALYGPTSPRLIGPWPIGGLAQAWDPAGTIQRRGNVWVVQIHFRACRAKNSVATGISTAAANASMNSRFAKSLRQSIKRSAGGMKSLFMSPALLGHLNAQTAHRTLFGTDRPRCWRAN